MHKIAMVTAGEERFPEGTIEAIREFAEIKCKRLTLLSSDATESFAD